jgi:flagellum-specific peptidoglycan hydrolase FlgJ/LysM repeat protein
VLSPLRTNAALRSRFASIDTLLSALRPARQPARQMAVPMGRASAAGPATTLATLGLALALTTASMARHDDVVQFGRVALAGLRSHDLSAFELGADLSDVPAMDSRLAHVVDPRPKFSLLFGARPARAAVQPFEYELKEGESLADVAARFGTAVSALLWNNGLESADEVSAGARLTVLPVSGVLHLVQGGETLEAIAARYAARLDDLVLVNALDDPSHIVPGQVIVVAGATVPMPAVAAAPAEPAAQAETVALAAQEPAPVQPGRPVYVERPAAPAPAVEEMAADLPRPANAAAWQREFILSIAPGARESQRRTGVPASVTLAQAILESDWGRSKLTREANNLFGIKALRSPGTAGVYNIETWEVINGADVTVMAAFKAYKSLSDSIVDHGRWFHENSRYHRALQVRDDPRAFARAINEAGYATDPAYSAKLIALMERHGLFAYDLER